MFTLNLCTSYHSFLHCSRVIILEGNAGVLGVGAEGGGWTEAGGLHAVGTMGLRFEKVSSMR